MRSFRITGSSADRSSGVGVGLAGVGSSGEAARSKEGDAARLDGADELAVECDVEPFPTERYRDKGFSIWVWSVLPGGRLRAKEQSAEISRIRLFVSFHSPAGRDGHRVSRHLSSHRLDHFHCNSNTGPPLLDLIRNPDIYKGSRAEVRATAPVIGTQTRSDRACGRSEWSNKTSKGLRTRRGTSVELDSEESEGPGGGRTFGGDGAVRIDLAESPGRDFEAASQRQYLHRRFSAPRLVHPEPPADSLHRRSILDPSHPDPARYNPVR